MGTKQRSRATRCRYKAKEQGGGYTKYGIFMLLIVNAHLRFAAFVVIMRNSCMLLKSSYST